MLLFFFNDTATTEIYTLSLHDALPIFIDLGLASSDPVIIDGARVVPRRLLGEMLLRRLPADEPDVVLIRLEFRDRKSTRLNSSHANISYAVFCLKKKQLDRSNCQRHRR